ncbi:MAG: YihY/virulence factor BrkB family protein [Verrucomicrobiota bacterium]
MNSKFQALLKKGSHIREKMWDSTEEVKFSENLMYASLRVITITWQGIKENRLLIRAGALTFSSLLALAPMIALSVLVSGFILDKTDSDVATKTIQNALQFIAPQMSDYDEISTEGNGDAEASIEPNSTSQLNLEGLIEGFIENSQSGAVGISGMIMLVLIVIQLFSSIEDAFNDVWGVKRGRSWVMRIVMYWTILTLGAVLSFAGIAMIGVQVAEYANLLEDRWWSVNVMQIGGVIVITAILAGFYRFIPNTYVTWKAAFIGAFFAMAGLYINKSLAFLYVDKVALQKNLYGPMALPLVLMAGMLVFWIILLLGGRVTYAVQNATYKGHRIAWNQLSDASKEGLALLLFTKICRRFRDCEKPLTAGDLAEDLSLPINFINACLTRLSDLHLTSAIPPGNGEHFQEYRYQPARPLDRITLSDFYHEFRQFGSNPDKSCFDRFDPIVEEYHKLLNDNRDPSLKDTTFEDIIGRIPA